MMGGGDEAFRRTLLALYIVSHTDLHAAPDPSTAGMALGKFAFRSDTACSAAFWPAPSSSCTLHNQEKGDDARLRRSTPIIDKARRLSARPFHSDIVEREKSYSRNSLPKLRRVLPAQRRARSVPLPCSYRIHAGIPV